MNPVQIRLQELSVSKKQLRRLSGEDKNRVLKKLAGKILGRVSDILAANHKDVENYKLRPTFRKAFLDRLLLTEDRIRDMVESLNMIAAMPDPVGEVCAEKLLPNGLRLQKVRSALGVIFLIFEARPNVVIDAFALAFKAGNALILKGGSESDQTCGLIYTLIEESLREESINPNLFWGLVQASRETTDFLMKQNKSIDVLIPRGGDHLIEYVSKNSTIPIIKNDRGLCHVYVHTLANVEMALSIIDNAKTQRPSVCNSAETVLVDQAIAGTFLPALHQRLKAKGVIFYACEVAMKILSGSVQVEPAEPDSFDKEYLDLKLNIKVVSDLESALDHIEKHGSQHSEAIVTKDLVAAKHFQAQVDAAAVYWNASTRFTDGGQFGLGAEIGISTQKLHVRGPVGLEALTSLRWIIDGEGQTRE